MIYLCWMSHSNFVNPISQSSNFCALFVFSAISAIFVVSWFRTLTAFQRCWKIGRQNWVMYWLDIFVKLYNVLRTFFDSATFSFISCFSFLAFSLAASLSFFSLSFAASLSNRLFFCSSVSFFDLLLFFAFFLDLFFFFVLSESFFFLSRECFFFLSFFFLSPESELGSSSLPSSVSSLAWGKWNSNDGGTRGSEGKGWRTYIYSYYA